MQKQSETYIERRISANRPFGGDKRRLLTANITINNNADQSLGHNDNFDLEISHVMPALIRKFHEAKMNNQPEVVVWGTGKP